MLAAGAAVGCTEEMAEPSEFDEKTIWAVMDEGDMETRTCVSDDKGDFFCVLSEYAGEIIDMQSYLAASWECNNSMWPINHGKYSECGTRDFETTSGFCGDEELSRFSDIITAFHTAYMARLNGMNDFVSGKKWPVSEWQNKIN